MHLDGGAPVLDQTVVTGSRIARSGADTPTPTVVLGAADIAATGAPDIGEVLQELPAILPGTTAVDLNHIPPSFIERVEVITGEASAVYGADAVSGIINIITKTDYEGPEFNVQSGPPTILAFTKTGVASGADDYKPQ